MDRMKERLLRLLTGDFCPCGECKSCEFCFDIDGCVKYQKGQLADHLIANGITTPPVTVGQKLYLIRRPINKPAWVDEVVVQRMAVEYTADGVVCRFAGYNFSAIDADIGVTVFFNREDAEKETKE